MKDMIIEMVAVDGQFVDAVNTFFGEPSVEYVWVLIRNWFRHGYIGTELDAEQVWFVD
jgi:hypothetical protein